MSEDEIQGLRERPDMCAVFAVESLVSTALGNTLFQVPKWVGESRAQFLEVDRAEKQPNDQNEFAWLNTTLERLSAELPIPIKFNLVLQLISNVRDVKAALSKSYEVLIFGRTSDYRTPHMFHLGGYKSDSFGERFESLQQITSVIDLSDYFMRFNKCNAIFVQAKRSNAK